MTREEIIAMMQQLKQQQPEATIGPIPEGGISQQGILDEIIGGGGMGGILKLFKGAQNLQNLPALSKTVGRGIGNNKINKVIKALTDKGIHDKYGNLIREVAEKAKYDKIIERGFKTIDKRGGESSNILKNILGRNVKAGQNIRADKVHQNIDKLMKDAKNEEKLAELTKLMKLNPGSKIAAGPFPGIRLPDAPVAATPQSGGGIMDMVKKMLPWGLLGTTSDTPE